MVKWSDPTPGEKRLAVKVFTISIEEEDWEWFDDRNVDFICWCGILGLDPTAAMIAVLNDPQGVKERLKKKWKRR